VSGAVNMLAAVHIERHPDDSARIFDRHEPAVVARALLKTSSDHAAGVLARMEPRTAIDCFELLPLEFRRRVLVGFPARTAASFVRQLAADGRDEMLSGLPPEVRATIELALSQPPDSAAAFADPDVPTLFSDLTVGEAIKHFCQEGRPASATVFVIDRSRQVVGSVTAGRLCCAPRSAHVASLELEPVRTVPPQASVRSLVASRSRTDGPLAVVDDSGMFCGVLSEDVLQSVSRERPRRGVSHVAAALGEFYWVGLRDLVGSLGDTLRRPAAHEGATRDRE